MNTSQAKRFDKPNSQCPSRTQLNGVKLRIRKHSKARTKGGSFLRFGKTESRHPGGGGWANYLIWLDSTPLPTRLLYLLTPLGFALRLFRLDRQSLWFDDIITVHLARLPLIAGLDGLLNQGIQLTPLYHWVIKAWLLVGDSDGVVRLPALCFSVLLIPLVFQLGKGYCGPKIGVLAAAIMALNPYQIWYAHEVKVYSLLTVAAAGSMITFARLLGGAGKKNTVKFIIFNMVGFSSHYFMFLLPAVQFIFIVLHFKHYYGHFRKWLLINILSVFILFPWFGYIIARRQFTTGIGWVPRPALLDPLLTIWNFTIGYQDALTPPLAISLVVVVAALLIGIFQSRQFKPLNQLLLIWFFFPLIIVWTFSQGITSFYVDRYFLVITPALALLLSVGIMTIANDRIRFSLGLALLLATTYGLGQLYSNETYFSRDDWREMAHILRQKAQPGDGLVTCSDGDRLALDYYGLGDMFTAQAQAKERYYVYPANFDFNAVLTNYHRLWVIVSNPRDAQHHLGHSYPPLLDPTLLPSSDQIWFGQNPPQIIRVAGITAFVYALEDRSDLNKVVRWNCRARPDEL